MNKLQPNYYYDFDVICCYIATKFDWDLETVVEKLGSEIFQQNKEWFEVGTWYPDDEFSGDREEIERQINAEFGGEIMLHRRIQIPIQNCTEHEPK